MALRQRTSAASKTAGKPDPAPVLISNTKAQSLSTFTPPSFTVKELLGAIPKHCYERSALKSFTYLAGDIAMLSALIYLATFIDGVFGKHGSFVDRSLGQVLKVAAWAAYAFASGSVGTGIWIIAHECGHQSFSTSKTLNNAVGWVLHSFLLVPYHSWRISHARHHAATGSMERDEAFVPFTRTERGVKTENEIIAAKAAAMEEMEKDGKVDEGLLHKLDELLEDTPLYNLFWIVMVQLLGWPGYLICNLSGQNYGRWTSHFDPSAPIFDKRHFAQIIMSDIGLLIVGSLLTILGTNFGLMAVVKYYILPYLVVHHHLVLITFLQHTDPMLPHYRKGEWNFQRGALCTIDRNLYGSIGAYMFHGICETHVAHHICSKIPHYHAWEATEALKNFLGEHYMSSDENMYVSLYRSFKECKFVEDTGSCVFYKNAKGQAQRVVVYEADSGVDVTDAKDGELSS